MQLGDLSGTVALVVGAGNPIGRASALALGARGSRLVLTDTDRGQLRATHEAVAEAGGAAEVLEGQGADTGRTLAPVTGAAQAFGRLDHAVLSIGLDETDLQLATEDPRVFRRLADGRLLKLATTMQVAIRTVLEGGSGTVLNVASLPQPNTNPEPGRTLPVKHGVMGLTKAAAIDHATEAVRIAALCPGFPDTPVLEEPSLTEPTARARVEALRPVDRFEDPTSVGAGVAALCAPGPVVGAPPAAVTSS